MGLMGLCTFAVGLLPTIDVIGPLAGIILIILRILQGLALGGEYGGAATYIAEHARRPRGFFTSWIQTTATLGFFPLAQRHPDHPSSRGEKHSRLRLAHSFPGLDLSHRDLALHPTLAKGIATLRSAEGAKALATNPLKESFGNWFNLRYVLMALFGATMGQGVVSYTGAVLRALLFAEHF